MLLKLVIINDQLLKFKFHTIAEQSYEQEAILRPC